MKQTRIQLRRKKGWRLPENTVVVSRPSKWGNPYKIGEVMKDERYRYINGCGESFELRDGGIWIGDPETAVRAFQHWLWLHPAEAEEVKAELRGKNLACWCPLHLPCHGDALLRIANEV